MYHKGVKVLQRKYYVSVLTYTSETWTMGKRDKNKVKDSKMRFLRSSIGVSRRENKKLNNKGGCRGRTTHGVHRKE